MPEITDEELEQLRKRAEAGDSAAAALEKSQQDLEAANQTAAATRTALLDTVRKANPTIPAELIDGDTPEAITASVDRAQELVKTIVDTNKPAEPAPRPAGANAAAPTRTPAAPPEGLRGADRIRHGLNQMKEQE